MVYLRSLVRDQAAVDDLFQEAMVVAWRRLDECDLERPFGPWLRGIASRLVLAHYRKQKTAPMLLNESLLQVVDRHFENINLLAGDTWDDKVAALRVCIDASHHSVDSFGLSIVVAAANICQQAMNQQRLGNSLTRFT